MAFIVILIASLLLPQAHPIAAHAASYGTISGTVTDDQGHPVSVDVEAYFLAPDPTGEPQWNPSQRSATTDTTGRYTLRDLPDGTYTVHVTPVGASPLADQWWGGHGLKSDADSFTLAADANVVGVDIKLARGASIAGVVTNSFGIASGADVRAYVVSEYEGQLQWTLVRETTADANGAYLLQGLQEQSFYLQASIGRDSIAAVTWWPGRATEQEAAPIAVAAGQARTSVDLAVPTARVTGTLTRSDGTPVVGDTVDAVRIDGVAATDWPHHMYSANTDAHGRYSVADLPPGTYTVRARETPGYAPTFWGGAPNFEGAASFTVAAGETRDDTNLVTRHPARLSGVVTRADSAPVSDLRVYLQVRAHTPTGDSWVNADTKYVDTTGKYAFDNVAPGEYTLAFAATGVPHQWWHGRGDARSADSIDVAEGAILAGLDVDLDTFHAITGRVTAGGVVAGSAQVVLYSRPDANSAWQWTDSVLTAADGTYRFDGLAAGMYTMQFSSVGASAAQWWGGAPTQASATPITVTNASVGGIDAALSTGAVVSGTVTAVDGGTVSGTIVDAFRRETSANGTPQWVSIASGTAGADGRYQIPALPAGTYTLAFSLGRHRLAPQWWGDHAAEKDAESFTVNPGETLTGKNATLDLAARVTGRVVASDGSTKSVRVLAYRQPDDLFGVWPVEAAVWSDTSGAYTLDFLRPGRYILQFEGSGLVSQWWDGKDSLPDATVVELGPNMRTVISPTLDIAPALQAGDPMIDGGTTIGDVLTAAPGTWTDGANLTYQWNAEGTPIVGATSPTLALGSTLVGKGISVTVTGSKGDLPSVVRTSATTEPIKGGVLTAALPTIEGSPAVGATLSVARGAWTPGVTFQFEWLADGVPVPGATGLQLVLAPEQAGKRISVVLTGSRAGYGTVSRRSPTTAVITGGVLSAPAPSISGTPRVGSTLSASTTGWTPGAAFAYRWLADGAVIGGAASSKLVIPESSVGKRISVEVTGSKPGFDSATRASDRTDVVAPAPTATPTQAPTNPRVERLSGASRFETSAVISSRTFSAGVPVAYIASGLSFPDALAGAPVAGAAHGPILLVSPDAVPAATITELGRLKPGKIVILGGVGAVSTKVEHELAPFTTGGVARLAGADRFATAAAISSRSFAQPGVPIAYVANGLAFPDALSGAPAAAVNGGPVLLVTDSSVPFVTGAELARLKPAKIVLLGAPGAVSTDVERQLKTYATTHTVQRLAGATRYSTSAAISTATFAPGVDVAYVANGLGFADALSGAPAAGALHGPVLLVSQDALPTEISAELRRLKPKRIIVLGGPSVVSENLAKQLAAFVVSG